MSRRQTNTAFGSRRSRNSQSTSQNQAVLCKRLNTNDRQAREFEPFWDDKNLDEDRRIPNLHFRKIAE